VFLFPCFLYRPSPVFVLKSKKNVTYIFHKDLFEFMTISCLFLELNESVYHFNLKRFKILRQVSILSDHHQGALVLAKVILQYSQFSSYLQTRCCGSISCCVGMCCGEVARCASYDAHLAISPQHIPTQHDMLPQHLVCKYELNCEYYNITLARDKAP